MLNTIHLYKNDAEKDFNTDFLASLNDISIQDLVVLYMKEYEAIENIEILSYDVTTNPDEIDINEHSININYKRKTDTLDIPKYKYISTNRVGEMRFRIRVHTNINEKIITKKILIPLEYDGFYYINNKKWKTLWQLCDASTYNQRGKITMKSRMPIIIYQSKHRPIMDMAGLIHEVSVYSYALNSKSRRGMSKVRVKFINPMMIYSAKIGLDEAIKYFCAGPDIAIVPRSKVECGEVCDDDRYYFFNIDEVVFKVRREMMDNNKYIASVVGMLKNMESAEFPVTYDILADLQNQKDYWRCRIGYIGSAKSKNLLTFLEKGRTTIYMVERLLDTVTRIDLRLDDDVYKNDIYALMRWMIFEFDNLKTRNNMDLHNKRIRKNEYIVGSTLGKKIAENINKIIEKQSKSKMNTMDTLLESFNFASDIIVNGMRNNGDLVKSDELVNDFTALQDMYFSAKGPNLIPKRVRYKLLRIAGTIAC